MSFCCGSMRDMKRWLLIGMLLAAPTGYGVGQFAAHHASRPPTLEQILWKLDEPRYRPSCECRIRVIPNYIVTTTTQEVEE